MFTRRFSWLTLMFISCWASVFAQSAQSLSSDIERVKIFLQGAEITRTAEVTLPSGKSELVFTDLAPTINPQTIRLTTPSGTKMLAISNRTNFMKSTPGMSPDTEPLRRRLASLRTDAQRLQAAQKALEAERVMLEKNIELHTQQTAQSMSTVLDAAALYRERVQTIYVALAEVQRELKTQQDTVNVVQAQLQELGRQQQPTSEVYLTVESKGGPARFTLQYVVNNCGWSPVYDLYAGGLDQAIRLNYRALAFNNTGIDWKEVALMLSTADPLQTASQPLLKTWKLRDQSEVPIAYGEGYLNLQLNNNMLNQQIMTESRAAPGGDPLIQYERVEIAEFNSEFTIGERYSIPANSKPYSVEITEHELPATYQHYAVPKLDKDAFLLARITGWEALQLQPGPMNIYRDNSYIGIAELNTRYFNDTLDLSLGRDPQVVIKRTKRDELSQKQFLGNNKKWTVAYRITVKNNHPFPIKMELLDQLPVSDTDDITVTPQELSGADHASKTGKLRWTLELGPGASRALPFGFEVRYPKDLQIRLEQTRQALRPRFY